MERINKPRFAVCIEMLNKRAGRRLPAGELADTIEDWWHELRRFDLADVEAALRIVREDGSDFFPSLARFEVACSKACAQRLAAEEQARSKAAAAEHEADKRARMEATPGIDDPMPSDPAEQDKWIEAAATPADRLVRKIQARRVSGKDAARAIVDMVGEL